MIKLNIKHCSTCLPCYFGGHHLAWICVPVHDKMTFKELRTNLHSELNQGAIGGSEPLSQDDSGIEGDKWFKAAHAAINRDIKQAIKGNRFPFKGVLGQNLECGDEPEVYAYFVFDELD